VLSRIRQAILRVKLALSWRGKARRIGATLRRFALVEADSSWQYLRAADALPESSPRAQMFLSALEETHHSALFYDMARTVDPTSLRRGESRRKALLTDPAELGDFLATVEASEDTINADFEVYASAASDPRVSTLFRTLRRTEPRHDARAHHLLLATVGSPERLDEAVDKARRRQLWTAWKRIGADTSDLIASVLLSIVFFVAGPFFARRAHKRVAPRPLRAPHALPES